MCDSTRPSSRHPLPRSQDHLSQADLATSCAAQWHYLGWVFDTQTFICDFHLRLLLFDFVVQLNCSLSSSFFMHHFILLWVCLLSLSDHIQKKLFKQQRRHRRRAESQRATVHSVWTETRNGLCIPPHCSDTKGLGGGC